MSSAAALAINASNCLHDAAIVLLAVCGLVLSVAVFRLGPSPLPDALSAVRPLRRVLSMVVICTLIVITAAAVPRILLFKTVEFDRAAESQATGLLMARHALALFILISGSLLWIRSTRMLNRLTQGSKASDKQTATVTEDRADSPRPDRT